MKNTLNPLLYLSIPALCAFDNADAEAGTMTLFDALPSTEVAGQDYDDIAKSASTWLSRLQLYTKGVAIDTGLIPPGHYGVYVSKDEITDLGKSIDVLAFARRPKAVDMSDKGNVITTYDSNDPEFKRIKAKAGQPNSGCMCGVSFLVFERSTGQFFELFLGTKSSVTEAANIYPFMPLSPKAAEEKGEESHGPLPFTMKAKIAKNKAGNTWHVPTIHKCSIPIEFDVAEAVEQIEKFVNPPKSKAVDEPENSRER